MGAAMGRETDALTFLASLAAVPYRHDFYQALRRLECLYPDKPRWGRALRPGDEPVRLGQEPDLAFAPAPLAALETGESGKPPRLQVRLFGLFGPNGPLPTHVTEYARERLRHAGDPTLSRFLDLFHHRFLALFYRAWAQAQPHVNRDRPEDDRFSTYVGAFLGVSPASFRYRDTLPDLAKFFHVGALVRQVRNSEGLAAILQHFFRVPVKVEEFVGHWMWLGPRERTLLTPAAAALGAGAVLGSRVWDRQHKFRIHLGPLTLAQYEGFLPGSAILRKLVDWVRLYLCFELDWDVRLVLRKNQVPPLTLGGGRQLGWTTWLGRRSAPGDADDLCIDAERFVHEHE
ncbi:MAG TPA: type VI secretion system baseplate subunit TssG [Vicinamibacterales bacterium]